MNPTLLIPVVLACSVFALIFWRNRLPKAIPTVCEYWVYFAGDTLPKIEDVMDRMVRDNPYNRKGRAMIGGREGMLFTDIRMHIGLVKRPKNPKCFRPDLEGDCVIATPENLRTLAPTNAIARVRYVSEATLPDRRHLQFMPHLAGAMADLSKAVAVYDLVTEQLYNSEQFGDLLRSHANLERPDAHFRTAWFLDEDQQHCLRSFGLPKIGILEHVTHPVPFDQKLLVQELFDEALGLAWLSGKWEVEQTIVYQEIEFIVTTTPSKRRTMLVKIDRINRH